MDLVKLITKIFFFCYCRMGKNSNFTALGKKRSMPSKEVDFEEPPTKKVDLMIIDRLQQTKGIFDALKSITDSNDEIGKLLSQGGSGKELLNVIDISVEKLKASEISMVFNACEAFFLYVSSSLSKAETEEEVTKFKKLGIELCREILEDHIGYLILLLSGTNTAYQVISSLNLLTAMVTCCGQTAKEVLLKLDFEHKNWESVAKRQVRGPCPV